MFAVWPTTLSFDTEFDSTGRVTVRARYVAKNSNFIVFVKPVNATWPLATCKFLIDVTPNALAFDFSSIPNGAVGVPYSAQLKALNAVAPASFYADTPPGIAPGMTLDYSGRLTGVPRLTGTFKMALSVGDRFSNQVRPIVPFTVDGPKFEMDPATLPNGMLGVPYDVTVRFKGNPPNVACRVVKVLPLKGLTIDDGLRISGVPRSTGDVQFTFMCSNGVTGTQEFPIVSIFENPKLDLLDFGIPYSQGLDVLDELMITRMRRWTERFSLLEGVVPVGLKFASNGRIEGMTRSTGSFVQRWRVDLNSGEFAEKTITMVIAAAPTLPSATAGVRYSHVIQNENALSYAVSSSSRLPMGMLLDRSGVLSGTPYAAGDYLLTFLVEFSDRPPENVAYRWTVATPAGEMEMDTLDLPAARINRSYRQSLSSVSAPIAVRLMDGDLPPGLSIVNQAIEGTPSQAGYWEFLLDIRSQSKHTNRRYAIQVHDLAIPQVDAVLNSASYQPGAISPGEILTLFGSDLDGAQVRIGGLPAPVVYSAPHQLSAVVPFGVEGGADTQLAFEKNKVQTFPLQLRLADATPGIYTLDGTGRGAAAALNQDGTLNARDNAAAAGSVLVLYGTGLGALESSVADGQAASGATRAKVFLEGGLQCTVDGEVAKILYAGAAPGLIHGAAQVNIELPGTLNGGMHKIVLTSKGRSSTPVEIWSR